MTFELKTINHGEIEAGFFSCFVQYTTFGEYSFATRHFCELVKYLAENPDAKDARIGGYTEDVFWKKQENHRRGLLELIARADRSSEELGEQVDEYFKKEEIEPSTDITLVPVKVYQDKIQIGNYQVEAEEFTIFSRYVAGGGFLGWDKNEPDFAKPTLNAIKKSKSNLFKSGKA